MSQSSGVMELSSTIKTPEASTPGLEQPSFQFTAASRPRFIGVLNVTSDQIICIKGGIPYPLHTFTQQHSLFIQLLSCLDGSVSLEQLQNKFAFSQPHEILSLVQKLKDLGLIEITESSADQSVPKLFRYLQNRIAELEFLPPLKSGQERSPQINQAAIKGLILQHLHLIYAQADYVYPLLSHTGNTALTKTLQTLYLRALHQTEQLKENLSGAEFGSPTLVRQIPLPYTAGIQQNLIYSTSTHLIQGLIQLGLWQTFTDRSLRQCLDCCPQTDGDIANLIPLIKAQTHLPELTQCLECLPALTTQDLQSVKNRAQVFLELLEPFHRGAIAYYNQHSTQDRETPWIFNGGLIQ